MNTYMDLFIHGFEKAAANAMKGIKSGLNASFTKNTPKSGITTLSKAVPTKLPTADSITKMPSMAVPKSPDLSTIK